MRRGEVGRGVKLPRVHRVTGRNGEIFKYHRKTRATLPNNVPEDHPDFVAAWSAEEAKAGTPESRISAATGTVAHGCEVYLASRAYRDLGESYRPVIRRHVEAIKAAGGGARVKDLRPRHVSANLEPLSPAVARSRLKAWRKLGAFWMTQGIIHDNPTLTVRARPMPKSEGHIEWRRDDVERFREHWPLETPQRFAMELLQWTGARASDVVTLGPGMIDRDGLLTFRQQKTKNEVFVPWTAPADGMEAERADLLELAGGVNHMVFLTTAHGKPRSKKAFSSWFSEAATKAGLLNLSAHGLRKYRMNQLAENGSSVLKMQAWVGHVTIDEIEHYTRRADRRRAFSTAEPPPERGRMSY